MENEILLEENEVAAIEDIFTYLSENRPEDVPIESFPHADGIFIPNHYHPQIIEHGIKFWRMKKADKMIISGEALKSTSSSECNYVSYALEAGVSKENLFVEDRAINVLDEVMEGIGVCHSKKFFPESLIVCAFPPLLQRAYATFKKHFPKIRIYGSGFEMKIMDWCTRVSHIYRLLGELNRLREYSWKGDIATIEIPSWVASSEKKIERVLKKNEKVHSS